MESVMTLKKARRVFLDQQRLKELEQLKECLEKGDTESEAYRRIQERMEESFRRFEQDLMEKDEREEALDISLLFDGAGVLSEEQGREDGIYLKRECAEDYPMFQQLQLEVDPDADETILRATWEAQIERDRDLYCTIRLCGDGTIIGYCGIEGKFLEIPELSIELLSAYRHQGYGTRAMRLYLDRVAELGICDYIAAIDSDNLASQALFRKLGARLSGFREFMLYTEEERQEFEQEFAHLLSPHIRQLAGELWTVPETLLSHVLVYRLHYESKPGNGDCEV